MRRADSMFARGVRLALLAMLAIVGAGTLAAARADEVPTGTPDATLDLATREGVAAVQGAWRYHDAAIVAADFRAPGADLKPTGPPNRTWDIEPHAGTREFDDSAWPTLDATTLWQRRSTGRVCFNWYRLTVTVPQHIGGFDPTGATAVLDVVVDDYAEVWVDGALTRTLGQRGGSVVAGWNAPNRVVIGHGVRPGQRIQVAIFGINGPISDAPANYIWIRSARLDFYGGAGEGLAFAKPALELVREDPAFAAVLGPAPALEKLADGFQFTEGPVWSRADGSLLFSDPNANVIYRWSPDRRVSVFRTTSGYDGADVGRLHQPGSNGLTFDPQGRLTICEHGNRRVTRIEPDGKLTVLADRYQGKRLNSPNDLVYRSDGTLYFTDPPFGLPRAHDDPARELDAFGVYCLKDGVLRLVSKDLRGPNGIAFSPDERYLYVTNWDERAKIVMRYEVAADGGLKNGRVFYDMTTAPGAEALDSVKVDVCGDLYVSGPGGVWVISPAGRHLGTIRAPELPANLAWGDADGRTLYLTARTGLYRIRVGVPGARTAGAATSAMH